MEFDHFSPKIGRFLILLIIFIKISYCHQGNYLCFGISSTSRNVCSGNGICIGTDVCQCNFAILSADCSSRIFRRSNYQGYDLDEKPLPPKKPLPPNNKPLAPPEHDKPPKNETESDDDEGESVPLELIIPLSVLGGASVPVCLLCYCCCFCGLLFFCFTFEFCRRVVCARIPFHCFCVPCKRLWEKSKKRSRSSKKKRKNRDEEIEATPTPFPVKVKEKSEEEEEEVKNRTIESNPRKNIPQGVNQIVSNPFDDIPSHRRKENPEILKSSLEETTGNANIKLEIEPPKDSLDDVIEVYSPPSQPKIHRQFLTRKRTRYQGEEEDDESSEDGEQKGNHFEAPKLMCDEEYKPKNQQDRNFDTVIEHFCSSASSITSSSSMSDFNTQSRTMEKSNEEESEDGTTGEKEMPSSGEVETGGNKRPKLWIQNPNKMKPQIKKPLEPIIVEEQSSYILKKRRDNELREIMEKTGVYPETPKFFAREVKKNWKQDDDDEGITITGGEVNDFSWTGGGHGGIGMMDDDDDVMVNMESPTNASKKKRKLTSRIDSPETTDAISTIGKKKKKKKIVSSHF